MAHFLLASADLRKIVRASVIAIAMTLNELCTNTSKFGALSLPGGHVDIAWAIDDSAQRLHLTWTEKDGPVIQVPTMHSFGTRLVETLGKQLKGVVLLTYEPSGFAYRLDVPLTSLTLVATDN
jgi:two-component sensor histidine kinase